MPQRNNSRSTNGNRRTVMGSCQDSNRSLPLKKRKVLANLPVEQAEPLDLSIGHKCYECSRSFKALDRLKAHQRRHEIKKSGRYTCKLCNKPFVQQSSLITHMRIHTGDKPYKCDYCGKNFGDLSTFTKHLRTHTGERPYACEHCGQSFSQSGNKIRHIRSLHLNKKH